MEKIIYELKPFAFFYGSIYAIHDLNAYKPVVLPSALLLMTSALLIFMMRFKYRSHKINNRR